MLSKSQIAAIRKDYQLRSLTEGEVSDDPILQFTSWWDEALNSEVLEANAMTLATATKNGIPSARTVLLKGYDENGFIFFTNYESKKGKELINNPHASLLFFWKELERQVRIEGAVSKISEHESDTYFTSRPFESKIGTWSSPQSSVINSRQVLEENMQLYKDKYADGNVPRPPHWGGFILKPVLIEFWQGRLGRLHDRIQYKLSGNSWVIERLAP